MPSLALGSAEVTLLEMTRAYAAVATGNVQRSSPTRVRAIQGTAQQALYTRPARRAPHGGVWARAVP